MVHIHFDSSNSESDWAKPHWQAEEGVAVSEVPVGCVFVRDGAIIAKARNRTNELRNVSIFRELRRPITEQL